MERRRDVFPPERSNEVPSHSPKPEIRPHEAFKVVFHFCPFQIHYLPSRLIGVYHARTLLSSPNAHFSSLLARAKKGPGFPPSPLPRVPTFPVAEFSRKTASAPIKRPKAFSRAAYFRSTLNAVQGCLPGFRNRSRAFLRCSRPLLCRTFPPCRRGKNRTPEFPGFSCSVSTRSLRKSAPVPAKGPKRFLFTFRVRRGSSPPAASARSRTPFSPSRRKNARSSAGCAWHRA